ncbi:hypothetical protein EX895_003104 [Sporisorium graminicola]|uniref:RRM domain-containing protein n=1 Tax=Sporisorium graminicola TaxID=280036 RepID=A0A4U7KX47_9BASI|nr:hypothetical protein EX895_003104 [Sporisorium graminicola]TKY88008.1 hypothetical protein EX895_003104 [Sporisorium graminicola]
MTDSAEAFLAGIEDEVRSKNATGNDRTNSSSGRDRDRERERERERDRRDRRSGREAYEDDRNASSSSRKRRDADDRDDQDRYPRKVQRDDRDRDRRDRDKEEDEQRRRRRRDDDYYNGGTGRGNRDGRDGYSSYRRDYRDRGEDRYSSRRERSRYDNDDHYRERGNKSRGGDWRSAEGRDSSPSVRRSPTPEGTIPISERARPESKWDIPAPGFEGTSALAAKATGLFGIPGQTRLVGMPPVNLGVNGPGVPPGVGLPLPPIHMGGQPIHPHRGGPHSQSRQPYPSQHDQPYPHPNMHQQHAYPRSQQPPHGQPYSPHGSYGADNGSHPSSQGPSPAELAAQNANRQARRLYVGNITPQTNEQNIIAFFNEQMLKLKLGTEPGEPAVSAQVNVDKGYAFVEFRHPDEATNAMSFDGIVFQAQSLKIRRPKDYTGPDVRPPSNIHVPGVISTNVPDSPFKIFVGGLPTYLTDDQVIELLQAFGELRAFNLVKDTATGASKGFAFCEYVDTALTDLACQGLNGMELGDRNLVVQRASVGSEKKAQALAATGANAGALGGAAVPSSVQQFAGEGGDAGEPTSCMVMLNMVTPEELQDDEEYADIVEDIRDECTKYGPVTDVRVPRPAKESKGAAAHQWKRSQDESNADGEKAEAEREGVGRVYVRYGETEHCAQALRAIAGRQFGGRTVICAFLKEEDWPGDEDGGHNADDTAAQAKGAAFGL